MKIYKFIGFIALLGWSAVSCNDWLDVRPDTECVWLPFDDELYGSFGRIVAYAG